MIQLDLDQFPHIDECWESGPHCLTVVTDDGRVIRVTAQRSLRNGSYETAYEERCELTLGDWPLTQWLVVRFPSEYGASVMDCLERALRWIDSPLDRAKVP